MMRLLASVLIVVLVSACSGSGNDAATETVSSTTAPAPHTAPAPETLPPSTIVVTTTAPPTTLPATTTTLPPTGSVQVCDGFLTLDDPDADGYGECVVTLEDAQEQYFVISAKINATFTGMGNISASECPLYLAAIQTFVDDLKAATWPAEVQPQLDELVAANEYELFIRDDQCRADASLLAESSTRGSNAVFAWRTAIGSGTDF